MDMITDANATEMFNRNFSRLFKEWGGTQGTLSKLIGVTQSRISYWVNGRALPNFTNLYNLSLAFGKTLLEFYLPKED